MQEKSLSISVESSCSLLVGDISKRCMLWLHGTYLGKLVDCTPSSPQPPPLPQHIPRCRSQFLQSLCSLSFWWCCRRRKRQCKGWQCSTWPKLQRDILYAVGAISLHDNCLNERYGLKTYLEGLWTRSWTELTAFKEKKKKLLLLRQINCTRNSQIKVINIT